MQCMIGMKLQKLIVCVFPVITGLDRIYRINYVIFSPDILRRKFDVVNVTFDCY